ncbi:MAG: DNA repair protein RadC [Deltaproteobacteria bacterium]|nr:DNA repair protein RadC [Deltaproteobacteria bacterium]
MNEYAQNSFWQDLKSGKFAEMVRESSKGQTVSNSNEVYNILKPLIAEHDDVEVLYGVFMDAKNHILSIEKLFAGTITGTSVFPREIVKRIISNKATALLLAHNHPSGDTKPSREDQEITSRIGIVLNAIGVSLHDHIIIGSGYHSMADTGWLQSILNKFSKLIDQP